MLGRGLHVFRRPPEVEEVGVAGAFQETFQLAPGGLADEDVKEGDPREDVVSVGLHQLARRGYVVLEVVSAYLPQSSLARRLGSPELGGVHA